MQPNTPTDQNQPATGQPQQVPPMTGQPAAPNASPTPAMFQPAVAPVQTAPFVSNAPTVLPKNKRSLSSLVPMIALSVLLLASIGFGVWAFMGMQDYKNNSDQKSAAAVAVALEEQKTKLDGEYAEKSKQPFETYTGKSEAGSVTFNYPRTWSAYVVEQSEGQQVNGYLHPGFVPATNNSSLAFALRVEVIDQDYPSVVKQFESSVKSGKVTLAPFSAAKVPAGLGSIITGQILPSRTNVVGTLVVLPIRDKTLKLWTESNSAFGADFTNTVLPSLSYIP